MTPAIAPTCPNARSVAGCRASARTKIAGTEVLRVAVPHGTERYLRLFYIVDTGPLTAGKFTSGLVPLRQANVAYASGYVA